MWWLYGPRMGNFWFIPPVLWFLFMLIMVFIFYQLFKRRDTGRNEGEIESVVPAWKIFQKSTTPGNTYPHPTPINMARNIHSVRNLSRKDSLLLICSSAISFVLLFGHDTAFFTSLLFLVLLFHPPQVFLK